MKITYSEDSIQFFDGINFVDKILKNPGIYSHVYQTLVHEKHSFPDNDGYLQQPASFVDRINQSKIRLHKAYLPAKAV